MNPVIQLIQLYITEASNYRAPTRELKLQTETTLMVPRSMALRWRSRGRISIKSALKYLFCEDVSKPLDTGGTIVSVNKVC